MEFPIFIILIVIIFSTIQSIFGIGLLVFGTPSLLIMGFPFDIALTFLLPSSIIISLSQIFHSSTSISPLQKRILFISVPGIFLGLLLVLTSFSLINIGGFIGVIMILSWLFSKVQPLRLLLSGFMRSNLNTYIFIMGIIHGFSNMGGGLLTILVTSIFNQKNLQRQNIAFGYFIFGFTQIIVLLIVKYDIFTIWSIIFPMISIVIYFSFANIFFRKISESTFNKLISILVLIFGIILICYNISWF